MAQIDINKSSSFEQPILGARAYSFDSNGNPVIVKEDGSYEIISYMTITYIANRGVGLVSNLPSSVSEGDVYVTNDTFQIYIALDSLGWQTPIDLIKGQLITDTSQTGIIPPVYQYTGTELLQLSPPNVNTNTIDFSEISFDENGVSTVILESIFSFNIDNNYIYVKLPTNYWVRSKIFKEASPGTLPE